MHQGRFPVKEQGSSGNPANSKPSVKQADNALLLHEAEMHSKLSVRKSEEHRTCFDSLPLKFRTVSIPKIRMVKGLEHI